MKIIADANMPGLEAFARHGDVVTVEGRQINRETVAQADACGTRRLADGGVGLACATDTKLIIEGNRDEGVTCTSQSRVRRR